MFSNASLCVRAVFPACQWEIIRIIKCLIRTPLVCAVEKNNSFWIVRSTAQSTLLFLCGWSLIHIDGEHLRSLVCIWKAVDTFHSSQSGDLSSWALAPYPLCEADIYWGKASGRLSCQRQNAASSGWMRVRRGAFIRKFCRFINVSRAHCMLTPPEVLRREQWPRCRLCSWYMLCLWAAFVLLIYLL